MTNVVISFQFSFYSIYCIIENEVTIMQIISGLNYQYKWEETIKKCYQEASQHLFDRYIIITDYPSVVEQRFFQYTHYLVNIEIMTWNQFLKSLQLELHLTKHHVIDNVELTYHLRQLLQEETYDCFHSSQPYPLIKELIPLLKAFDINEIDYQDHDFDNMKLKDMIHLYKSLQNRLDSYTHLNFESLFDHCDFSLLQSMHLYIDGDHLYEAKKQSIINQLSKDHDVTILYTYNNDSRLFNMPYHSLCQQATSLDHSSYFTENLFSQKTVPCSKDMPYYTFNEPTPRQEIQRVVYGLYQMVVDKELRFSDFAIVYPDSSYINDLIDTLDELHIPHTLPSTHLSQYDYSYQKMIKTLKTLNQSTFSTIASELLCEELDSSYQNYLQSLLNYHDTITPKEFIEFFKATYPVQSQDISLSKDCVEVFHIEQVSLSRPKHIFFLGMNETIFPRVIKDTSLLLDEDIETLRQHHISTPLTTTEQLGVHYNNILKAFLQPSCSMTFSYALNTLSGETLLPSSLYKQLKEMFVFKEFMTPTFLPLEDYYLKGGLDENKDILNQHIHQYLSSKNQPDSLSLDIVSKLYSPTLSVSQIETYNKCPFQYYIQYGLGIYPLQENKLMPNELGSLTHYVLSICMNQQQDISKLVDEYINQDETLLQKVTTSKINQYFIEQLKKDLHITLTVLKRQFDISSFDIQDCEKKIESDISGMHFKGFVDRIDKYDRYISIIDYKSSAKDINLNLAMQGFNIQMLLYLKMVTQMYQKDPGAVLYFNTKKRILSIDQPIHDKVDEQEFYKQYRFGGYVIDDGTHQVIQGIDPTFDSRSDIIPVKYVKSKNTYDGHILTPKQLDTLLEMIEKHIYELYQNMLDGHILIDPKESDNGSTHTLVNPCHYCPYHSVCSFDVFYNDYHLVEELNVKDILGGEDDAV